MNFLKTYHACQQTYRAFMRFFAGVSSHVNHQHVLSLERFFVPRTSLPATHKRFLVAVNVIGVYVTDELILREKFEATASPMAVCFKENASVVFRVCGIGQNRFTARATVVVITHSKVVVFDTKNVFVRATKAVLLDAAVEVIGVTGILMVQMRIRR